VRILAKRVVKVRKESKGIQKNFKIFTVKLKDVSVERKNVRFQILFALLKASATA